MRVSRKKFEDLVWQAVDELPEPIKAQIHNLEIEVRFAPARVDFDLSDDPANDELFGLYHGIPLTERLGDYNLAVPDLITIFQRAHQDECRTLTEMRAEVRRTVRHEIAHYFGMSDERLEEIGRY